MEDHDACNLIALAVGSVMRQSLNDGFKAECKKLLGVTSTKIAEEILYQKLMETIQTGGNSTHLQSVAMTTAPSLSIQEEIPKSENATQPKSTMIATSTEATSSTIQRNNLLSEMFCQTMQLKKRSLSSQPAEKRKFKLWKGPQSSASY